MVCNLWAKPKVKKLPKLGKGGGEAAQIELDTFHLPLITSKMDLSHEIAIIMLAPLFSELHQILVLFFL